MPRVKSVLGVKVEEASCLLTLVALMVLEELHALKGSSTTNELMRELGLVVIATLAIDLLVRLLSVVC